MRGLAILVATLMATPLLTACGTYVPQLGEAWEPAEITDDLVYRIKKSIYCELRTAVKRLGSEEASIRGKVIQAIPDNWGVQMTMTLTVDETGSINPSGSYTNNYAPARDPFAGGGLFSQSFTLPVSTQLSSQSTRIDTYYSFFAAKGLKREYPNDTSCVELDPQTFTPKPLDRRGSSYLLSGNLGIESWLKGALLSNIALPSSDIPKNKSSSSDVLQYNLKFIVITTGSVNPLWKLKPISTGTGNAPLVSANRTRTHQLLITLGPADISSATTSPGFQANSIHNTGQIEQAVSTAFRSAIGQ